MEKLTKEMHAFLSPGSSLPAPLNINKGQEIHDRSKTAHRKPPVKCFLTHRKIGYVFFNLWGSNLSQFFRTQFKGVRLELLAPICKREKKRPVPSFYWKHPSLF